MKSRFIDAFLTGLGVAGLMVYVLACAPSFSPDGKKVAFPVINCDTGTTSVMVYDIKKNRFDTLAELANPNLDEDEIAYSVQWMPDGKQVLINGTSLIMMLPAGSKGPIHSFQSPKDMKFWVIMPMPPVLGHYQFISNPDESVIYRINLQDWGTQTFHLNFDHDKMSAIFSDGKNLFFIVELEEEDKTFYSIMQLDADNGEYTHLARIDEDMCGELKGMNFLALPGDRFAVVTKGEKHLQIVIARGDAVEKIIPVGGDGQMSNVGNIVSSPAGDRIYAAISDSDRFGFMEVPLDGKEVRKMQLFEGEGLDDQQNELAFQIAISPDGREIAASSVSGLEYEKIKPGDRAFYLVDISHREWKVKKIQVPLPVTSKQAAAGS